MSGIKFDDFSVSKNTRGPGFVVNGVLKDGVFHHIGIVVENAVPTFPIPQTGRHQYDTHEVRSMHFHEYVNMCSDRVNVLQLIPGIDAGNMCPEVEARFGILH